jgi:hypothetical protein
MATIRIKVSDTDIQNMLSSYILYGQSLVGEKSSIPDIPASEVPFKGGYLEFSDPEQPKKPLMRLDYKACLKGLSIMAKKSPYQFSEFIKGDYDAITADTWLQCALLHDVVYG